MIYIKHTACETCPRWNHDTSDEPPASTCCTPSLQVHAAKCDNGKPDGFKGDINTLLNLALNTRSAEVFEVASCEVKDGKPEKAESAKSEPAPEPAPEPEPQQTEQSQQASQQTSTQAQQTVVVVMPVNDTAAAPAEDYPPLPEDVPNRYLNDGATLEHLAKIFKYMKQH